jgi:hypothetical protein
MVTTKQPILAVVQLTDANREEIELREIPESNRVECLSRYIFRKQFLKGMRLQGLGFSVASDLAKSVPFLRLARPQGDLAVGALADCLLDRVTRIAAPV